MSVGNGNNQAIGGTDLAVDLRASATVTYSTSNWAAYSGMSGSQVAYTASNNSAIALNAKFRYNFNNTDDEKAYWSDLGTGTDQTVVSIDAEL